MFSNRVEKSHSNCNAYQTKLLSFKQQRDKFLPFTCIKNVNLQENNSFRMLVPRFPLQGNGMIILNQLLGMRLEEFVHSVVADIFPRQIINLPFFRILSIASISDLVLRLYISKFSATDKYCNIAILTRHLHLLSHR